MRLTYPGISCETCRDIEEKEGLAPQCVDGECTIPPPPASCRRALDAWTDANALRDLGGGAAALSAMTLSPWELRMVAAIERFVQSTRAPAKES